MLPTSLETSARPYLPRRFAALQTTNIIALQSSRSVVCTRLSARRLTGAGVFATRSSSRRGMTFYMGKKVRRGVGIGRIAALATALSVPGGGDAFAQGVVKTRHGGWETRCETPPGASAEQ